MMELILQELFDRSVRAAILILLVWVICSAGKRLPAKYRCIFWLLTAAVFLIPTDMRIRLDVEVPALADGLFSDGIWTQNGRLNAEDILTQMGCLIREEIRSRTACRNESEVLVQMNHQSTEASGGMQSGRLWMAVWLGGTAAVLGIQLLRYQRMSRKMKTAVRISGDVFCSDQITVPLLFGVVHPRIILPVRLMCAEKETVYSGNERKMEAVRYAVLHEQMHLRRKDSLVKLLVFLICAVYWWNLFAWLLFFSLEAEMEYACDEAVLEQGSICASSYAQAILDAEKVKSGLWFGINYFTGGTKMRIKRVIQFQKAGTWQKMLCLLIGLLIMSACVLQAEEEKDMTQIWQEIAEDYPEFPEHRVTENRDWQNQLSEGELQVTIKGSFLKESDEAFRELAAQMVEQFFAECSEAERLNINWVWISKTDRDYARLGSVYERSAFIDE